MSTERNDGGPAFPIYTPDMNVADSAGPGMSLRDWFAAHAPVDWDAARQAAGLGSTVSPAGRQQLWAAMSVLRYEFADAMLAERAKGGAS